MNNIRQIMQSVNGASFIGIDTTTDVKLKGGKKNELQGLVEKVTIGSSVMVFQNKTKNGYHEMIKRRLEKEGKSPDSFELGPRSWGTRMEGIPFVEHKGEYYLEVIFLHSGNSHYEVMGHVVSANHIEGLPESRSESSGQGGLEDKVVIRTFKVSSITKITINKETFTGPFIFE